ncbi:AfsR family transcriptional regulator [Streptomyces albospinus]|uniref:AfsR family transcriptional regulator n=1 Tax=Streptomyces albospinus TaxID=285515 RepID=A0ABQ2VKY8_9ACTN|nr:AfsR family transcriptional regulator [Streptomyces albospinus]
MPLGGPRLRALTAALALRAGRGVDVATLIDDVWAVDGPPQDAPAALQALVGRLRRALGKEAVASLPGAYRLAAAPDEVDLHRFARLVADGTRALQDGDPAAAAETLRAGLALWRGPALADLPDGASAARGPEALRLTALHRRIDADLALGRATELLPELRQLTADHPLDEPFRAQLIRALDAAGQSAAALAAYEDTRLALADRLGADPGPELRHLHARLLGRAGQSEGAPMDRRRTAAPGAPARSGNLRPRLNSFLGRESELTTLRQQLRSRRTRLITLTGPGGSGKTRLAEELAASLAADHPDGAWIAELAPLDAPEAVPGAVLSALGLRDTAVFGQALEPRTAGEHPDPAARIADHCADRRLLLVLDNCEHVIGAAAALADQLLRHCPQMTVLATSREPLGVPGETVRPLEPLRPAPAHQLFAERAAAVRPDFRATDETAAVDEICRRLDGLPLAIELAAARLRLLSARQIADRLDDRFRLLTSGSRTALPRQQTLRAVVDWSWELLDAPERALLRRLSAFAGGCTLAAAEAVCGDQEGADDVGGSDHAWGAGEAQGVLHLLGALVDKSLLLVDHRGAEPRYRMLETIHAYAKEQAAARPEERDRTHARHTAHYLRFVTDAGPRIRSADQLPWLARIEAELDNVRAVLHRALAARDAGTAQRLALAMGWFWWLRNYRTEGASWVKRIMALGPALEELGDTDPEFRAQTDLRLLLLFLLQDHDLDREFAAPEKRSLVDRLLTVYSRPHPGSARFPGLLWPFTAYFLGGYAEILPLLESAVATTRELGGDWELGVALLFRTHITIDLPGGLEPAEAARRELTALARRIGDRWLLAQAAAATGEVRQTCGRYEEARAAYEEALALTQELGAYTESPWILSRLAELHFAGGDLAATEKALIRAEEQAAEWHVQDPLACNHALRARMALLRGDPRAAHEECEAARAAGDLGTLPPQFTLMLAGLAARIATASGDAPHALRLCHDALSSGLTRYCPRPVVAAVVESAASALHGAGRPRDAARLLGAADTWRGQLPRPVPEEADVRRTAAALRAELNGATDGAHETLHAEGTHLTPADATALLASGPLLPETDAVPAPESDPAPTPAPAPDPAPASDAARAPGSDA